MSRLLLGVSGGIAAYKALETARLAVKAGHAVRVIQTPASERFVGRASFEAITGAPVLVSEWEPDPLRGAFPGDRVGDRAPISHLALVEQADLFLIAPATANTLAKLAAGQADNLLTAAALAAACPVLVAPAMNDRMYRHPATQANLATLAARGVVIIGPGEGELASEGEHGIGRLSEPAELLKASQAVLALAEAPRRWAGLRVLVTAGGTRERIDSVRFIGNRSSGRMGVALADRALARGAEVTLVAANLEVPPPAGAKLIGVETAAEMKAACEAEFPACDVLLMAAAVADFRPSEPVASKIKKSGAGLSILALEPTDDILAGLAAVRRPSQVLAGFAAEHGEDAVAYGREKLAAKGLDIVVVNDISRMDIGFDSEANEVVIVTPEAERRIARAPKADVADAVLDEVARHWEEARGGTRTHAGSAARG
ncbi:MAG TPA: bifunctional phosphopantothenoylcysteine decarboxylase/phosphopantothenate--cysteine ligase CoaBC [Solirubrobacteraceae bacterium]|nr:bifunctional phosphopantothenoylcysteine decarboxylase/phosphopantothenate--cysteine ligase CoaBC [Solirubrobacteraceae bacterium]